MRRRRRRKRGRKRGRRGKGGGGASNRERLKNELSEIELVVKVIASQCRCHIRNAIQKSQID